MKLRTLEDLELDGRRALLRADFNVPLENGVITEASRLQAALPTIEQVRSRGASLVLMSHLGRPKGQVKPALSLAPVAAWLTEALGTSVQFVAEVAGPAAARAAAALPSGGVLLLENTRFHPGETKNDDSYARELAALGDCFVSDAFGTLHRAHASNAGVARHLPSAAGRLVEKEVAALAHATSAPERPYVVIMGGGKVGDKLPLIEQMMGRADRVLVGGALANTLLKARGVDVAESRIDPEALDTARALLATYGERLVLPDDLVIADDTTAGATTRVIPVSSVPAGWRILDVGPDTVRRFDDALRDARTIMWNGPVGMAEVEAFAQGTRQLARILAAHPGFVIVGGGDTVAALAHAGDVSGIDHVSTGGGASLAFLAGEPLPGLEVLRQA
jgi:phosphoglycerate kinase